MCVCVCVCVRAYVRACVCVTGIQYSLKSIGTVENPIQTCYEKVIPGKSNV